MIDLLHICLCIICFLHKFTRLTVEMGRYTYIHIPCLYLVVSLTLRKASDDEWRTCYVDNLLRFCLMMLTPCLFYLVSLEIFWSVELNTNIHRRILIFPFSFFIFWCEFGVKTREIYKSNNSSLNHNSVFMVNGPLSKQEEWSHHQEIRITAWKAFISDKHDKLQVVTSTLLLCNVWLSPPLWETFVQLRWLRCKMLLYLVNFRTNHMLKISQNLINSYFWLGSSEGCVVYVEG